MRKSYKIYFTDEDVARARARRDAMPDELKNSVTHGRGTIIGCLGEIAVEKYLGITNDNTFQYDMIYNGKKLEVKSRETTVYSEPGDKYWAGVFDSNDRQRCDIYVWTRVHSSMKFAWVTGWLFKDSWQLIKVAHKKGDPDPYDTRGWCFPADSHDVLTEQLNDMEILKTAFEF